MPDFYLRSNSHVMLIEIDDKAEHEIDCKTASKAYCLWNSTVRNIQFLKFKSNQHRSDAYRS